MQDLTVIYLTASLIPQSFAGYQRKILLEAIGDFPLISVSRKPLDFGMNILDVAKKNVSNIYFQMLRAAKVASTKFIAIAEDDTLYPKEHFTFYRPEMDTFAYNLNRLALFTWGIPTYSWRNKFSNCSLVAPRLLTIKALEERFKRYPKGTPLEMTGELGREDIAKDLQLTRRKADIVYSTVSIVQFNHDYASEAYQRNHKKKLGPIRSFDIPYWGKAADLVTRFK